MAEATQNSGSIFGKAIELGSTKQRAAYLDEVCGTDEALRAEVESLLAAHEKAVEFLVQPVGALTTDDYLQSSEILGKLIGHYKLREKLGEGGMGTVYVADQTEPVQRRVAIKLIKSGSDSKSLLARFEQERQALALMDHPNIAKVLDAGIFDKTPYFVMELIKGVPITKYCDDARLSPQETA